MKTCYCEKCRRYVEYEVRENVLMEGTLKGGVYRYEGKEAVCKDCKSIVYVAEINDANLKALYDEYRKENDIISQEKIVELQKRYGIGKRPLSQLLGWGEMTFSRYCDGDMPSKQYSDILVKIFDNPQSYLDVLESNKEVLTTVAYEKSRSSTLAIIEKNNKPHTKIDYVINYLLSKCNDITPLALQKALYYIQGFYYSFAKEFIFEEECQAWVHGPVYSAIYGKYRDYRGGRIALEVEYESSKLTGLEKAVIDSVIRNICCYSGRVLEQFTHLEMPWLITRGDIPVDVPSDKIIGRNLIAEYFCNVKEKYNMLEPSDIADYTQTMFKKVN